MNLELAFKLNKDRFQLHAHVQIQWQQPSTHVIFGKSGIGKSHLLRCICGLENPTGVISWHEDHNHVHWLDSERRMNMACHLRPVTMVFQDNQLFSHLNVEENLRFAFDRATANEHDWQHCIDALKLRDLLSHQVQQLSGGQAQRVALARAILSKPKLLILDEPLASLDWQSKQDVMDYIKRLNHEWQLPVLYVTHDIHEVLTLADQVIMLHDKNAMTQVQTPRPLIDILQDENHPFYGLGKSSILIAHNTQHQQDGLLHCQVGEQLMRLPIAQISDKGASLSSKEHTHPTNLKTVAEENKLRLCIAANDVSLALSEAKDSSIVNTLQGKVSRIEQTTSGQYLIQLKVDDQYLLSEISAYSFKRLNIEMWQPLFAQIKGVALQRCR